MWLGFYEPLRMFKMWRRYGGGLIWMLQESENVIFKVHPIKYDVWNNYAKYVASPLYKHDISVESHDPH